MKKKNTTALQEAVAACKANLGVTILFSFFINLLMFVAPLHMLQIYDRVLVSRSEVTLIVLTVLALGLLAIYGILEGVRSRILVRTGLKFDEILNDRLFRAVFRGSVRNPAMGTGQALRDMDMVREFISGGAIIALCDAPWVPIFIFAGFLLHPVLGLISLGGAIIIFALALANELLTRKLLAKGGAVSIQATNTATASLRNSEVVHAMGMISAIKDRWTRSHGNTLTHQSRASDRAGGIMAASRFVRMALQVSILGTGAFLAIENEISPGVMIAASIIMGRALAPVELAVGQWKNFSSSRSAYQRLSAMFEAIPDTAAPMELPAPKGHISVQTVTVVPPGGRVPVVKGLTLDLTPGTSVGLVGPSGSGKSSLARALVGVWPVVAGSIRYDGAELAQWDPEVLGPHLGYMPQDVELFDGTVAENIARFQDFDPGDVVTAAQKAGVHNMILELPDGYDTSIGAGGQALSGGQRQRVALARALYGEPRILILDEPNANLDTDGEQALSAALQQAKADGCTVVVISHRPSLLAGVDKIAVLKDGVLVKYGPRDRIMNELSAPTPVKALATADGTRS
ncbi:type I secretion system permease/ATPase [Nisaea sp.]|uniref:type I secretion system permease/ATPase n=3 Tax=Nisaea sp. TaxID=2024842 RepID=UPI0032633373